MTGQNVRHILDESQERNIFRINKSEFMRNHKFHEISANDAWKVNMIKEITDINHSVLLFFLEMNLKMS